MAEIEQAYRVLSAPPVQPTDAGPISHYLFATQSLLHYASGETDNAIASQIEACDRNVRSGACREDYLLYDLAWLETLCRQDERTDEFQALCDRWSDQPGLALRTWYLTDDTPDATAWEEEWVAAGRDELHGWSWVDPLGKTRYERGRDALVMHPLMGGGFLANATAPRLMRTHSGNFSLQASIDNTGEKTWAGGLLVFADDYTLLRFGAGLQCDSEVTLTVKSDETGFATVARGILEEAPHVHLRLVRRGNTFSGWCGDGATWYRVGEVRMAFPLQVQVGIFAECTYRMFSLERCTDNPVRFESLRFSGPQ